MDSESTREMLVPGGRLFEQRKATLEALDKIDGVDYSAQPRARSYLFPRLDKSKFDFENAQRLCDEVPARTACARHPRRRL
ncbi:MAG: hypothetical protein ACLUHE_03710 [Christensenellales bacterium]